MTQATHTPGPWRAYSSAAPGYPATVARMDGADEVTICDVTETGARYARLIAAAPELLAVLADAQAMLCELEAPAHLPEAAALDERIAALIVRIEGE